MVNSTLSNLQAACGAADPVNSGGMSARARDIPALWDSGVIQVALLVAPPSVLPNDHVLHADGAHVAQHLHLLITDILRIKAHLPNGRCQISHKISNMCSLHVRCL